MDNPFTYKKPPYSDTNLVTKIQKKLCALPGLIKHTEIDALNNILEKVFRGEVFILQAGDCAERFSDAQEHITQKKCDQIFFLQSLIESIIKIPVVPVGRIAGQYAKPRSSVNEALKQNHMYAYHGDMINSEISGVSRNADPNRMLEAYTSSKTVISHISKFEKFLFTCHECFLLEYENSMTRLVGNTKYNLSTHTPWLGMRHIESEEHINYLSSIANPIAIKVGPTTPLHSLVSAIQRINKDNKGGKIIITTRIGFDKVADFLPQLIEVIHKNQLNVIWTCDPLHGNTQCDSYSKKFRLVPHAVEETIQTKNILNKNRCNFSGLHLEVSPETDILECILSLDDLIENRVYKSALDPRLNYNQCILYIKQALEKFYTHC